LAAGTLSAERASALLDVLAAPEVS
jgi:hypothetical protein